MYISKAKKYRDQGDGTAIAYDYYRLTKSYIDKDGKTKHRSVLCLGELPGFDKDERNRLAAMLTTMIEDGQSVMCDNRKLYEEAMSQYVKYRGSKYAQENDPLLIAERKAREEEERKKAVAVKLETLTQHEARIIGCENLCNSTMRMLDIRKYQTSRGWKREQACKRYEEGLEAIKKGILTKGGTKKRDAVNKRLGKLDKQYGAIRLSYNVTFTYEGTGKNEVATSMTWECREDKAAQRRKFHGKYVLLTSLDESQELNIWKFYNVIRTVEETFHVLKTDLDIRPVYHKSDNGIKSHLNLAILAYWVVSVTKYRLKLKKHENVRWDEIMRIASTQVVVTAKVETIDGQVISIRQSTEAESKLSAIYDLLYINPKPLGKRKSMLHPNQTSKNPDIGNQGVT